VSGEDVHLVEVASGRDQTFSIAHPLQADVFDYSPKGIYLAGVGDAAETGVWVLDPTTGQETLLTAEKIVEAVGDGKVWLVQGGIFADTLVQLDPVSGSKTVWFHQEQSTVDLLGLTARGTPIVSVRAGATDQSVWIVLAPGVKEQVYSGPRQFDFAPINDSHGIWLGSNTAGIYFYASGSGLLWVSAMTGAPAGTCL
jgi:hypothetical protein